MRAMLIFLLITVSCTVSGIQSAHASTYDPKVKALYSPSLVDYIIKDQIEKHKGIDLTAREKTYIHDTVDAIADREYADKVQRVNGLKPGEHYEGR